MVQRLTPSRIMVCLSFSTLMLWRVVELENVTCQPVITIIMESAGIYT